MTVEPFSPHGTRGPLAGVPPLHGPVVGVLILLALILPAPSAGQEVGNPLSPAGRLRVDISPMFASWGERFGLRTENGVTVEEIEDLGFDLDDATGLRLFPGVPDLTAALRQALDDESFQPVLGRSRAEVGKDVTRVPIQLDIGVFDWLTAGVMVPLVKNRTEMAFSFRGDSAGLGVNPAFTDAGSVIGLFGEFDRVLEALEGAGDLEVRAEEFARAVRAAYNSGALFPVEGSAEGEALRGRMDALNADLQAAGVSPVDQVIPLAAAPLRTTEDVQSLIGTAGRGFAMQPLRDVEGLWELGDVEVHAVTRLAHGAVRDSAGAPPRLRYVVGAGALVRLGTGTMDDPAVVHDIRSGDGQNDVEGRLFANVEAGAWGLHADARYGVQLSTTLPRRVAPPEVRVVPRVNRATVEWTPGDYLSFELGPRYHLNREIALVGHYRFFHQGEDEYERITPVPEREETALIPAKIFADVSVLAQESEQTVHDLGIGIVYSTVDAWRAGETGLPLEFRLLVRGAVAGSGGETPRMFRAEARIRLFRRLWGG